MTGVIVNDSILKVDEIKQLRKHGYPTDGAIIKGEERRLKPILITSMPTIPALIPFLFSSDLGNNNNKPLPPS